MAEEELFFVRDRALDYPVFDVDNHMYENTDALTKFLPPEYDPLQRRSMAGLDAVGEVHHREREPPAHALNQWMLEHWTYNYENAVFPTPMISLARVDKAVEELEWVAERGARVVYLYSAPVSGFGGRRSIALREFDPWDLMEETGIVTGFHQVVNRRYPADIQDMDGTPEAGGYFDPPGSGQGTPGAQAFRSLVTPRWRSATSSPPWSATGASPAIPASSSPSSRSSPTGCGR